MELAGDQIERSAARLVADCGPDAGFAPHHTSEAESAHEPLDGAAGDRDALAFELRPDLVGAVHLAVLIPHPPDGTFQDLVSSPACCWRPGQLVHFFRDVAGIACIEPQVLQGQTTAYREWVDRYTQGQGILVLSAPKGVRQEELVRPYYGSWVRTRGSPAR